MEINTGHNVFTQSPQAISGRVLDLTAVCSLCPRLRLQLQNFLSYFRMMITQTTVTSVYTDKDPEHLKLIWSCREVFLKSTPLFRHVTALPLTFPHKTVDSYYLITFYYALQNAFCPLSDLRVTSYSQRNISVLPQALFYLQTCR